VFYVLYDGVSISFRDGDVYGDASSSAFRDGDGGDGESHGDDDDDDNDVLHGDDDGEPRDGDDGDLSQDPSPQRAQLQQVHRQSIMGLLA